MRPFPRAPVVDEHVAERARERQSQLTKPAASLGALEELAIRMAAFQNDERPRARPAVALIFAADHPVTRHGVSAFPSAVTAAMIQNFIGGGAASSVMARALSIPLAVIDVGVENPTEVVVRRPEVLYHRHVVASAPEGDIRVEDAMSEATYQAALEAGMEAVDRLDSEIRVVVLGEMGIGNTTLAAALGAALLDIEPGSMVGAGTGVVGGALEQKRQVVRDAVRRLGAQKDPQRIVRALGGREIVALMGAAARAIEQRKLVLVDGFVVTAAMLALTCIDSGMRAGMLFAHRSHEQAHGRMLEALQAVPLLDLQLRLGEATGALAAFPLLDLACSLHNEMATFAEASVPERS